MNLFGGKNQPDPEKAARDERSQRSIAAGGLPVNAVERLTEQERRRRDGKPFFTSNLSVNELLLTHQCGFEPLGQVMGSCVYHSGWQYLPSSAWFYGSSELAVMTQSQIEARDLAFSRLRQEAKLLGGDGVVGVRFTRQPSSFGGVEMEYMAIGTAVRKKNAPPLAPGKEPFVSNLSGQDHWQLRNAGFAPVGFVFGACVWYQYPDWRSQSALSGWWNAEVTSLSLGTYTAREIAMSRVSAEANLLGARGVVGVDFESHFEILEADPNQNRPGGFIMHCTAWGTAIGADSHAPDAPLTIKPILPINP